MSAPSSFDYIVIGAGTAGCVLANRLSANSAVSVLLLEAGPADKDSDIRMPAAFPRLATDASISWSYETDAEPWLNGRRLPLASARVVGGESSINSMDYLRATAQDFDRWSMVVDDPAWSYHGLVPYYRRAESHPAANASYRGDSGPMMLQQGACRHPLHQAFIQACKEAGYPYSSDLSGYQSEGVGPLDMAISKGERCSVASAYLRPAAGRANLHVELDAHVADIQIVNGVAKSVDYIRDNWTYRASANTEIIVCAGAINSPHLLMRSGIGNPSELEPLGIHPIVESFNVGENLQDQLQVTIQHQCKQPISLSGSLSMLGKTRAHAQWRLGRSGPWASSHYEAGALLRSDNRHQQADVFCRFLPLAMTQDGLLASQGHSYQVEARHLFPASRGFVKLRSADPLKAPRILFNYLSESTDREAMRDAVHLTRALLSQSAFAIYRGQEIAPGEGTLSDSEIDVFVRENTVSAGHLCGTCRMGSDDGAVVDESLRVNGVDQLRVVDASVMPTTVTGSLTTTTIMVAEKAADLILDKPALPVAKVAAWPNEMILTAATA